jgi:hypothetical protein
MALMRSTATAGSVSSSLGMRAWVLAVEEATETEEGHFRFTGDGASGERRGLWRIWGRVWEKAAGGAAWREDSCWIADALLDAGDRHGGASSRDLALDALTGVPEQRVSKCRVRSGLHRPEPSQLRVCWTLVSSRVLEVSSQVTGYGNGGDCGCLGGSARTETVLRLSTTPSPRLSPAMPATPAIISKIKQKGKMLRSTHKHLGRWALHAVAGSNGGARRMCRARPNRPAHVMFLW